MSKKRILLAKVEITTLKLFENEKFGERDLDK